MSEKRASTCSWCKGSGMEPNLSMFGGAPHVEGPCKSCHGSKWETEFVDNAIACPYCGYLIEDDLQEYKDCGEAQCPDCEKNFKYEANYSVDYSSHQVPCLNGGEHAWRSMVGWEDVYPNGRYCRACEKRDYGEKKK